MSTYEMWCITVTGISFTLMACLAIIVMWAFVERVKANREEEKMRVKKKLIRDLTVMVTEVADPVAMYCMDHVESILNGTTNYTNIDKVRQGLFARKQMILCSTRMEESHERQ